MNYKRIYDELIESRLKMNRKKSKREYFEKHHIVPKCLGGKNEQNNYVLLTAREHFICHFLLTKIYDSEKLKYAFNMMYVSSDIQSRYFNSRLFQRNKENLRAILSERMANMTGEDHHSFGIPRPDYVKEKIKKWHEEMTESEKIERKLKISETTKIAMDKISDQEKDEMVLKQTYTQYGYHFIMVEDSDSSQFLFKNRKTEFRNFLKTNNYTYNFYHYPYGEKYIPKESYVSNASKSSIEKDKNSKGLIQYKMERIKI